MNNILYVIFGSSIYILIFSIYLLVAYILLYIINKCKNKNKFCRFIYNIIHEFD